LLASAPAAATDQANGRETLGTLYLRAERAAAGRIVVRERETAGWRDVPGWRFHRQVIRVGLFLRERLGLRRGDCILVVSELRSERLVAEWAGVARGALVATLDPRAPTRAVASALAQLSPRVVFAASYADRTRVLECGGAGTALAVVTFEPHEADKGSPWAWPAVLDLGGTLDTAERAQLFRSEARAIEPPEPALAYLEAGAAAAAADEPWQRATHGELARRIAELVPPWPPEEGGTAYVHEGALSSGSRLALWGLLADGRSTLAIGTPGQEAADLRGLEPRLFVVPQEAVDRVVPPRGTPQGTRARSRADLLARLAHLAGIRAGTRPTPAPLAVWTPNGTRIR
jgi:hypothetical protein